MRETMMDYIHEQQQTCTKIVNHYEENLQSFRQLMEKRKPKNWLILATGSSYNAALSAKYYMENIAGIQIEIVEPFSFVHYEQVGPSTDFTLAISQSGKSASTIEALKKANIHGNIPTAVLTANLNSPITEYTDLVIDIGCGVEKVGYVTKGFSATVLTLMLMGIVAGATLGTLNGIDRLQEIKELQQAIDEIPTIIKRSEEFYHQYQQELTSIPRFAVVGYGPTYGTARESETKFTETVRVPTQGFELEAYMHGPYLEVDEKYGLIVIQTNSQHVERAKKLKTYFSNYTEHCFSITCGVEDDGKTLSIGTKLDEFKSPLLLVIPFQVLAYRITLGRGIDIDEEIFGDFDEVLKSKI